MSSIWNRLVDAASQLTGIVPVANGGTGLSSGTSGGVPYYSASGAIASSGALTSHGVIVGGGAGATPATLAVGTTGQLLVGATGANPAWGNTVAAATTFSAGVVFNGGGANLNWYEEGSFTPTVAASGTAGAVTYTLQFGTFTRVGRLITATWTVIWSNWTGSPTGSLRVAGFPYSIRNASGNNATCALNTETVVSPATANAVSFFGQMATAQTFMNVLIDRDNNSSANVTASSNSGATSRAITGTVAYEV